MVVSIPFEQYQKHIYIFMFTFLFVFIKIFILFCLFEQFQSLNTIEAVKKSQYQNIF